MGCMADRAEDGKDFREGLSANVRGVCGKGPSQSSPPDIYALKTDLLQRVLLLRLAKPASLFQLCPINPAALFVCNNLTSLLNSIQ